MRLRLALLAAVLTAGVLAGRASGRGLDPDLPRATWLLNGRPLAATHVGDPALPPVLFIHGSPGSASAWERLIADPALQAQAHLIAVDRPGFGGSSGWGPEPSLLRQAEAALDGLRLNRSGRPAVLVGHSLGGPVAARAAMLAPDRVGGLLLLAASVDPAHEAPRWYNHLADRRVVAWLLPRSARTSNEEILPLRGELEAMMPGWATLKQPTIVLHGEADRLVPVAHADFLARALPHARVRRLPGEDHFIPWTREDEVKAAIAELLAVAGAPSERARARD